MLNEPLQDKQPDDMVYETMIVNAVVPVATETNLVNTKFNEIQQVKPMHLLNEPLHDKLVIDMYQ